MIIVIYFMKWFKIFKNKQFSIFIFENKMTAILVQNLYVYQI